MITLCLIFFCFYESHIVFMSLSFSFFGLSFPLQIGSHGFGGGEVWIRRSKLYQYCESDWFRGVAGGQNKIFHSKTPAKLEFRKSTATCWTVRSFQKKVLLIRVQNSLATTRVSWKCWWVSLQVNVKEAIHSLIFILYSQLSWCFSFWNSWAIFLLVLADIITRIHHP